MLVINDHQASKSKSSTASSSSHLPPDDIEQTMVAADLDGRTIRNNTVGPRQWLGENARELASYVADLRPVDHAFLDVLPNLHVVTDDYVHTPVETTFNWDQVAAQLGDWEGDWFIVAFRSVRKATANNSLLFEADARAQEEAIHSGGLLKYWFGDLNQHRECLAMCIWINRDYAQKATHKPLHIEAARLAGQMYDTYTLERYRLVKRADESKFEITALPFTTPHPSF